jgi:hypothetical protein
VSITIGSDLKWWKINPCETSKGRNMFQDMHRCDRETTVVFISNECLNYRKYCFKKVFIFKCGYQDVPEYENGYYLASYKCVCKQGYEFPFVDYGSSYFEGATVEKEYDKRMNGEPNIYDRLKCRKITIRNLYGRELHGDDRSSANKNQNFLIYNLLFVVFIFIFIYSSY